jgi:hypothetical protein
LEVDINISLNAFWPDIFIGIACLTLMQAAVTGKFRGGGRGGGHVSATFNAFWLRTTPAIVRWCLFAWALKDVFKKFKISFSEPKGIA